MTSLYCFSFWSLTRLYSRKRPALVTTTFSNSQGGRLRELRLYKPQPKNPELEKDLKLLQSNLNCTSVSRSRRNNFFLSRSITGHVASCDYVGVHFCRRFTRSCKFADFILRCSEFTASFHVFFSSAEEKPILLRFRVWIVFCFLLLQYKHFLFLTVFRNTWLISALKGVSSVDWTINSCCSMFFC